MCRLLFPARSNVDLVPTAAALGADHARAEIRDFSFGRITPHFDQRSVTAGVIEARRNKPLHAQLAHVAERLRWAGWVLGVH